MYLCFCILHFLHTFIFAVVYFQYKFIFVFVFVRERGGEQQKRWIPCSFCLLPVVNTSQGPQQAESLHPPDFDFDFIFHLKYISHRVFSDPFFLSDGRHDIRNEENIRSAFFQQ